MEYRVTVTVDADNCEDAAEKTYRFLADGGKPDSVVRVVPTCDVESLTHGGRMSKRCGDDDGGQPSPRFHYCPRCSARLGSDQEFKKHWRLNHAL